MSAGKVVFGDGDIGLARAHLGKQLGFDSEDIFDWMVLTEDGRLSGGYTICVTRSLLPEAERAGYDAYVGVRVYEPESVGS